MIDLLILILRFSISTRREQTWQQSRVWWVNASAADGGNLHQSCTGICYHLVSLYFLQSNTRLEQKDRVEACCPQWMKGLNAHIFPVWPQRKASLFQVSFSFGIEPSTPTASTQLCLSSTLTQPGIVGRYVINRLDPPVTPGHKSDLLLASTPPTETHRDQGWQINSLWVCEPTTRPQRADEFTSSLIHSPGHKRETWCTADMAVNLTYCLKCCLTPAMLCFNTIQL